MGANSGQPVRPQVQKAHFQKEWTTQETTNAYVTLGTVWDKSGFLNGTIQLWNTDGANSIDYQILGSLDGTNYDITVQAETAIASGGNDLVNVGGVSDAPYIPYLKIQIKSTVADTPGDVNAFGVCI